jgi:hypothetical protein
MTHPRIATVASSRKQKALIPVMAYEHVKQCLQVAQGRFRADAAIVSVIDQCERDRKRALAFVKGGAMRSPTRLAAAQLAAEQRATRPHLRQVGQGRRAFGGCDAPPAIAARRHNVQIALPIAAAADFVGLAASYGRR